VLLELRAQRRDRDAIAEVASRPAAAVPDSPSLAFLLILDVRESAVDIDYLPQREVDAVRVEDAVYQLEPRQERCLVGNIAGVVVVPIDEECNRERSDGATFAAQSGVG